MARKTQQKSGCGCCSIPFSVILLCLGGGYFLFTQWDNWGLSRLIPDHISEELALYLPIFDTTATPELITPDLNPPPAHSPSPLPQASPIPAAPRQPIENIRGIYLSRYQATNNADEETIRQRVRYYRSKGINTIIHGVWGNACTMYRSQVMQAKFGYDSCPNQFQDQWLDWLIDEAHQQGMEVHAYFEKGIKIDQNSHAFDLAVQRGWIVPGVDRTHPGVDHYVLDVSIPAVAEFFTAISVEFVQKYPQIDAVQWDDYLGYYDELPGDVDRTEELTQFVRTLITETKAANPRISFDICHHNPYWAKRYFAADWETWGVDRAFIQVYGDENFEAELPYVKAHDGISITERQFDRIAGLIANPKIEHILFFPLSGNPEKMAEAVHRLTTAVN